MKKAILVVFTLGLIGGGLTMASAAPTVVEDLDIDRYMGRWYAVASIPTSFERQCAQGTTADYRLLESGQVEVTNTCYNADGVPDVAVGRAWIPDSDEPTKLKVSFVRFLGFWLFPGAYWVIDLADDYSYAVVGHPTYRYGWILSRMPTMPPEILLSVVERLEAQGYDFKDFRMIDQSIHAPEAEETCTEGD
jgi:apolipoprotein D and lipocalin family protein